MSDPTVEELVAALRVCREGAAEAINNLETERDMQMAEVERLRAGLDFYANPANWEARIVRQSGPGSSQGEIGWEIAPADDGGERARRALNVEVRR